MPRKSVNKNDIKSEVIKSGMTFYTDKEVFIREQEQKNGQRLGLGVVALMADILFSNDD